MSTKFYTGIGSRETPTEILDLMHRIARHFTAQAWWLRSGGARGADTAFEEGADLNEKEIYLPWKDFNNNPSKLYTPTADAYLIASTIHPIWESLSYSAKRVHARNVHQVLGRDIQTPSELVICWTKDGARSEQEATRESGGTRTAIVVADRYGVPVLNLRNEKDRNIISNLID